MKESTPHILDGSYIHERRGLTPAHREISRRDFLKLATAGSAGVLAACGFNPLLEQASPTPTPVKPPPTERPTPLPTRIPTRTPEPTPTLEPLSPPEVLKVNIPDLKIVKQKTRIYDETDKVDAEIKKDLKKIDLQKPDYNWNSRFNRNHIRATCGSSILLSYSIFGNRLTDYYYYDGNSERIYTNLMDEDSQKGDLPKQDLELLGWQSGHAWYPMSISCDGKILYQARGKDSNRRDDDAHVMVDINNQTRTIFQFEHGNSPHSPLSYGDSEAKVTTDWKKILISSPFKDPQEMKMYLVDLQNWSTKKIDIDRGEWARYEGGARAVNMNEDGSLLYSVVKSDPGGSSPVSAIIDTRTGSKRLIRWPRTNEVHVFKGRGALSPDFRYVAHEINVGAVYEYTATYFPIDGVLVYTPNGFFQISLHRSLRTSNFSRYNVRFENDGTLFINEFHKFKFINGTYQHEYPPANYPIYEIKKVG